MQRLPNLKTARQFRGISQVELSAKSKIGKTSILNIENGHGGAKPATAKAIADALGFEIWQLMSDDPKDLRNQGVKTNV